MDAWHLIIDVAECTNCGNCQLAEKDEHVGNDFPGYSAPHSAHGAGTIRIDRKVRGGGSMVDAAYLPQLCNHCDEAPCIRAAPDAITKRPDGIVIFDPQKTRGRRDLVDACPYGAVIWNEALNLPQQWTFDAHLLDQGWHVPRCHQACPTGAIRALKTSAEQMREQAAREGLEVLRPELGTRPRVYYRNLSRIHACFIGGCAVTHCATGVDCAEGVEVRLIKDGKDVAPPVITDAFGDFKFDGLAPDSGPYRIELSHRALGYAQQEFHLKGDSIVLNAIELKRSA